MAQNECQQMEKTEFYRSLRNQLSKFYNEMTQLERMSEFLLSMDTTTATNMGIPSDVQSVLADLRSDVDAFVTEYKKAGGFKESINKLRYI
jgi:hypothetical protein